MIVVTLTKANCNPGDCKVIYHSHSSRVKLVWIQGKEKNPPEDFEDCMLFRYRQVGPAEWYVTQAGVRFTGIDLVTVNLLLYVVC